MDPTNEVLTVDEIAELLRVPPEAVLEAILRKRLPAKKFGNKHGYRIRRVDYEQWLATPSRKEKDQA